MLQNIFRMTKKVISKVTIVQRLDCKIIQLPILTRKKVINRVNTVDKHDYRTTIPGIKRRRRASNLSPKHSMEKILRTKLPKSCKKKSLSVTILPKLRMRQT